MGTVDLLATSGNGPAECRIALKAMLDIFETQARLQNCLLEINPGIAPDRHGPKSAIISLKGSAAERIAAEHCGTIRFLFKSPIRPGHKRQNWFISVQRLEINVTAGAEINAADLRYETLRAGGPGGQHQNTTDSAVRVVHVPTGLRVTARDERSQHRNRILATQRLQAMLAHIENQKTEALKFDRFLANHSLERGNEVKTFRL